MIKKESQIIITPSGAIYSWSIAGKRCSGTFFGKFSEIFLFFFTSLYPYAKSHTFFYASITDSKISIHWNSQNSPFKAKPSYFYMIRILSWVAIYILCSLHISLGYVCIFLVKPVCFKIYLLFSFNTSLCLLKRSLEIGIFHNSVSNLENVTWLLSWK